MAKRSTPVVRGELTRCPECGSTERTEYCGTVTRPYGGTDESGRVYTHVTWRRTRCAACGTPRRDLVRENRAVANLA